MAAAEWSPGFHLRAGAVGDSFRDSLCELTGLSARVCRTSSALLWVAPDGREVVRVGCGLEQPGEETAAVEACSAAAHLGELYVGSGLEQPSGAPVEGGATAWSFAAFPLAGSGNTAVGALCVLDRGGNPILPDQLTLLRALAQHAASEVRRHGELLQLQAEIADRTRTAEELDMLFHLSLDMLCIAGFDGYFKRINPAWERTLGYTRAELLARPYLEFVHPDDREPTLRQAANLSAGSNVISFENRYVCRDGSLKWLAWAAAPIPEQQLVYGAARDITERRLAEEDLHRYARNLEEARQVEAENAGRLTQLVRELESARARAERAARAKSEFLAGMSDEIESAMASIRESTDRVLQTQLDGEQVRHLNAVREAAGSLSNLTGNILDFSRIETGRIDLERVEFSLRDVLDASAKSLAPSAHEKGLELACEIGSDVPDGLVGDPARLRQVVAILISNAVKFTERGEVLLRVESQSETEDDVLLHVAVIDVGIGIPPERLESVFDAYAPGEREPRRRSGSGLGLPLAARLVEAMKGRIWVESEPGQGSTFHLTARFELQKSAARRPVARKSGDLRDVPVLVVDDNATSRRILVDMLSQWHMRVEAADGAAGALAALQRAARCGRPFALALIDAAMPEVNGIALAGMIRRDPQLARTPVLMLAPAGMQAGCARLKELGIVDCLPKPVRQSELLDMAVRAVRAHTGEGPSGGPAAGPEHAPERADGSRVLDAQATIERLGGDTQLLRQLAALFLEDGPRLLARVKKALESGDSNALNQAVHTIKGAIGNFVAPVSLDAARTLETHVRRQDLQGAAGALRELEREVSTLQLALSEFAPRRGKKGRPEP